MKIDFGAKLKTLEGKDIFDMEPVLDANEQPVMGEDGQQQMRRLDITLKLVCIRALMAQYKGEEGLSGEDKLKRWSLAQRINGGNTEVEVEDVALLKKLIGKGFAVGIVGPAYKALENNA